MDQATLLEQLGPAATARLVERFRRFAYLPPEPVQRLVEVTSEPWGERHWVLERYLAACVPWSIEQGRYAVAGEQIVVTAGLLSTRYGLPLYLALAPNRNPGRQPWFVRWAGTDPQSPELPLPPEIPAPPPLGRGLEIVLTDEHVLERVAERVAALGAVPPVAQLCAVAGAIQWSIHRGLGAAYFYFGRMQWIVPLYLNSRDDVTLAPDVVAPVEPAGEYARVRTVLELPQAYANARIAVRRNDELQPWLLDGWRNASGGDHASGPAAPEAEAAPAEIGAGEDRR